MLVPRIVAASTHRPTFGAEGLVQGLERMTPSSQGCLRRRLNLFPYRRVAYLEAWLLLKAVPKVVSF